jgi:hypothetical protein
MNLGVRKMKKINLIKLVPMVMMGFALTVQAQGDIATKSVSWTPSTPSAITIDYPVTRVSGKMILEATGTEIVSMESGSLENWMFQPEYLINGNTSDIENWMLDDQHLTNEINQVEGWMKDPGYLTR